MILEDEIKVSMDRLDDDSVCVNFDLYSNENDEIIQQNGYVLVSTEEQEFIISIFDSDGNVVSQVNHPFNFKKI